MIKSSYEVWWILVKSMNEQVVVTIETAYMMYVRQGYFIVKTFRVQKSCYA